MPTPKEKWKIRAQIFSLTPGVVNNFFPRIFSVRLLLHPGCASRSWQIFHRDALYGTFTNVGERSPRPEKWLASRDKYIHSHIVGISVAHLRDREEDRDRMERHPPHSVDSEPLDGAARADTLYNEHLKTSRTLGGVRTEVAGLLREVREDPEAQRRIARLQSAVDRVAVGNENIAIEDLGPGTLGINRSLGTKNTAMDPHQLEAAPLMQATDHALDTALHENSEALGHAGQSPTARVAIVDEQGNYRPTEVILEGNVVDNVERHLGKQRPDLPEKTYKEGQRLVQAIGARVVDTYVRIGGANAGRPLQVEFWKRQPHLTLEEMTEQGIRVGIGREETLAIAREIRRSREEAIEPQLTVAA